MHDTQRHDTVSLHPKVIVGYKERRGSITWLGNLPQKMTEQTEILLRVRDELRNIDALCAPSTRKTEDITQLLKGLYDLSPEPSSGVPFGPLRTLTTVGMDLESLWEQLQTRNKPLVRFIKRKTSILFQALKKQQQQQQSKGLRNALLKPSRGGRNGRYIAKDENKYADQDQEEEEEMDGEEEMDEQEDMDEEGGEDEEFGDDDDTDEEDGADLEDGASERSADKIEDDFHDNMDAWLDDADERDEMRARKMLRKEQSLAHKGAAEEVGGNCFEPLGMLASTNPYHTFLFPSISLHIPSTMTATRTRMMRCLWRGSYIMIWMPKSLHSCTAIFLVPSRDRRK